MVNKQNSLIIALIFLNFFRYALSIPAPAIAQTEASKPQAPRSMHFLINVTNRQDAHSNNSMNVCTQQIAKQPSISHESQFMNKVSELWQENLKVQKQLQEQGSHFFSNNKWYLLAGTLACSYAYLAYFIMRGNSYLGDANLWSSWHQELPLDQLLAIPQQQMTQELIHEIQRRYTDASSIADIVKPLGMFMVKIDQEEDQIKWYQSVYSWLTYLRLNKLVPVNQNRFGKICERLQRIAYYKNLFKSWTADYQLQQAERMWHRSPENSYPDISDCAQLLHIEMRLKALNYWLKKPKNCIPKPA